jgi:hypothetical protein
MERTYQLTYSRELLRRAALSYYKKVVGIVFPIILGGFAVSLIYEYAIGEKSWILAISAAFVAAAALLVVAIGAIHVQRAHSSADKLQGSTVTLTVREDAVEFQSKLGSASIPWSQTSALYSLPEFILLQFAEGGYTSVPREAIDSEGIQMIQDAVLRHGGKVA